MARDFLQMGSASILLAAAGILSAALSAPHIKILSFCSTVLSPSKLSGKMPDRAGNMPALPR